MSMRPIKSVDWLVVHCAATPAGMDIGVKEIRQWHLKRGFSDCGYHYVIRLDGTVEKGRTDTTPGAHARGYNLYSLGICMVGGLKKGTTKAENNFTEAQFISLQKLLSDLRSTYPDAEILGHRDLPGVNKACPSFDVREWLATLEENEVEEQPSDQTSETDTEDKVPTRFRDAPSVRGRGCRWR